MAEPAQRDAFPGGGPLALATPVTGRRLAMDILLGVVLPIVCFALAGWGGEYFLGPGGGFNIFLSLSIPFGMLTLMAWLTLGARLAPWSGVVAGVLLWGAVLAFIVGVFLLPISVLGLILLIGALGFMPFFTASVYLRQGLAALRLARRHLSPPRAAVSALLGVLLVTALPAALDWQAQQFVDRAVQQIVTGDEHAAGEAVQRLRYAVWCRVGCYDDLLRAYESEKDMRRRMLLASTYADITGQPILSRLYVLHPSTD